MRISKLEPSQRVKGRWLVWLDDGSLLRISENEVLSFALYAGMELTEDAFDALTAAARASAVRSKALDLISARPLSRRELIQKLTARPRDRERPPLATPEQAGEAADWLEGLGYLDDAAYAGMVARHYSARAMGSGRSGTSSFAGACPGSCGTPRWRRPGPRRRGWTPFCAAA